MKNGQKTHSCGTITTQVCNSKKENNDVLPPSSPKGTMDRQKEFHSIHSVLIQGYSNSPDSNNAVLEIMWFPICTNLSIMYSLTEYASWKHSYELIEFSSETVGAIAPMLDNNLRLHFSLSVILPRFNGTASPAWCHNEDVPVKRGLPF